MIRVANAPCSWGILEFDRSTAASSYTQVLDEIHQTGYAGTELGDWGFMPTDPVRLREEMIRRDLRLIGGVVPVPLADAAAPAEGVENHPGDLRRPRARDKMEGASAVSGARRSC